MFRGIFSRKTVVFFWIFVLASAGIFLFRQTESSAPQISYQRTPELGEAVVVSFPFNLSEHQALKSFSISPSMAGELRWIEKYRELYFVPTDGFDPGISYTVAVRRPFLFFAQIVPKINKRYFQPEELPTKFTARVYGSDFIYYITESGLKRPVTLGIFYSYPGNKKEDLRIITEETLKLYPDNKLIRLDHSPEVYLLENDTKRLIKNSQTFNALGLDWEAIAPVNQAEFSSYPAGDPIRIDSLPHQEAAKGKLIDVDLATMKLAMWENGKMIEAVSVAGKGNPRLSPTRKGFFTVLAKENNHLSSLSRVWMPWSVRYSGNYYLHGWPYWPNGARLTSQYSAGCVRLQDADAKKVYDFAEVGIPVLVR